MRSTISRDRRAFSMASAALSANWEMKRRSCIEKGATWPDSSLALMSWSTPTTSPSRVFSGTTSWEVVLVVSS